MEWDGNWTRISPTSGKVECISAKVIYEHFLQQERKKTELLMDELIFSEFKLRGNGEEDSEEELDTILLNKKKKREEKRKEIE